MNILLLGAGGQLGQAFLDDGRLAARGSLVATTRDGQPAGTYPAVACDIADAHALRHVLDTARPALIINAAAYTAVDKAETEPAAAMRANGEAPGVIGDWARTHGALVVHYSTDYVFKGDATAPYQPGDATAPRSVYGQSKLAGEVALRTSGARHLILRTAWVYSHTGHNFLRTMLRLGATHDTLRVVADQCGTPTSTALIVDATLAALHKVCGAAELPAATYHLTAAGQTTWHGFAEMIFDQAVATGILSTRPSVVPITTAEYPTPAARPAFSVLDTRAFSSEFGYPLPGWREVLEATFVALRTP